MSPPKKKAKIRHEKPEDSEDEEPEKNPKKKSSGKKEGKSSKPKGKDKKKKSEAQTAKKKKKRANAFKPGDVPPVRKGVLSLWSKNVKWDEEEVEKAFQANKDGNNEVCPLFTRFFFFSSSYPYHFFIDNVGLCPHMQQKRRASRSLPSK